jgi:hypothetical protein
MNFINYRKSSSGVFDVVLNLKDMELCKTATGITSIPFLEKMQNAFVACDGNIADACTKTGEMKLENFTFRDMSLASVWPEGEYKTTFKFFDDVDDNIFNITYLSTK